MHHNIEEDEEGEGNDSERVKVRPGGSNRGGVGAKGRPSAVSGAPTEFLVSGVGEGIDFKDGHNNSIVTA